MSVLVSKRTLSRHEYVNTFMELYNYTNIKLNKVPKRKRKFLCEKLISQMNLIYNRVMEVNNEYLHHGIKLMDISDQAKYLISQLYLLQKPLVALWNIEHYKTKYMAHWADMIDKEINVIASLGHLQNKGGRHMYILDYEAINKANFIKTMSILHRFVYTKIIPVNPNFRDTKGILIIDLADEAWYRVTHANRFVPTNKKMYEQRVKDIEIAFDCLRKMQQPVNALFNYMGYSENTMLEWSRLITEEMKLLKGLQISDRKRFADLT